MWFQSLKVQYDELLSIVAFNFNVRRCTKEVTGEDVAEYLRALVAHRVIGSVKVGGCTFTPAC